MKFLYESPLADKVAGVVMDAPMLDFNAPVDLGGRDRHLPGIVISSVKWMTTARFGVDWMALDYLRDADRLNVPILLFHGENRPGASQSKRAPNWPDYGPTSSP